MQRLSKFMYMRGIGRIQTRIKLNTRFFFHYSGLEKWKHSLFAYDVEGRKALEPIELSKELLFDFEYSRALQIGSSLFVFRSAGYQVVGTFRLDLSDPRRPECNVLTSL